MTPRTSILLLGLLWACCAPAGLAQRASTGAGSASLVLRADTTERDTTERDSAVRDDPRLATPAFRPARFWSGMGAFVVTDAAVMYGLANLWYSGHDRTDWHWYRWEDSWLDDWHTYVQQDKLGHLVTAWHLARAFGEYGEWSGLSPGRAGLFGGLMSTLFQSQIEILDGYSEAYGASRTDLLANAVGGAIGGLQVAYPELTWFTAKYSYHRSPYYDHGVNYFGNALKDYDGISYWLVVRPERLLAPSAAAWWPDWLAFSVGYSGDGLAHGVSGCAVTGCSSRNPGPEHRRQLYLGLDFDLLQGHAEWRQPFRTIGSVLSFIRIPAPAVQLTPELKWYLLFY